ncbi:MAG TPA: SCO family protein [Acidimicrobiales bacterium]|nr:SCO family protein [Acidimicrobiales bacterium]
MDEQQQLKSRIIVLAVAALVVTALLGTVLALIIARRHQNALPTVSAVQPADRTVPDLIARLALIDQSGRLTDLQQFHGRVVVFADFMTSCQEICPITTGALLSVEHDLVNAHLQSKVEIVEATIDPNRDTPSRLRAYQQAFDVHWTMLTGTQTNIDRLWSWVGVYYQRVKEAKPAAINWQTHRPYTYDLTHSDAVVVLDRSGNERFIAAGNPNVGGKLPKALSGLLDTLGHQNLVQPGYGSWTPADMVGAIGSLLGQSIPTSGS